MYRARCAVIFAIAQLSCFVLIQYRSVTDRQTDGHLCSGYTSACIARYANAVVKMMGLPYGEEIMIVGRTMCPVTDRRTDRQTDKTDRITIAKTVQRIASHGKNVESLDGF